MLTKRLSFDGKEDTLTDESRVGLYDPGADGFTTDDVLFGFKRISNVNASGVGDQPISEQILMVFAFKVTGGAGTAASPYTMGPVADGTNDLDLRNLLAADIVDDISPSVFDDAMAVVITNPGTALSDNPINFTASNPAASDLDQQQDIIGQISEANGFGYEATLGFDDAGVNQHGDADFTEIQTLTIAGVTIGFEAGGYSVLEHIWGSGTLFDPVLTVDLGGGFSSHDVSLDAPHSSFTSLWAPDPWDYTDNAQLRINANPEPSSMVGWGLLALGTVAWRRRKRAAKTN